MEELLNSSIILCRLKMSGIHDCKVDKNLNITYVGRIDSDRVILPYGVLGVTEVGFSGLDLSYLKLNKGLLRLDKTALANCSKFKEILIYENQLGLIEDLCSMYPNLVVSIHKEIN